MPGLLGAALTLPLGWLVVGGADCGDGSGGGGGGDDDVGGDGPLGAGPCAGGLWRYRVAVVAAMTVAFGALSFTFGDDVQGRWALLVALTGLLKAVDGGSGSGVVFATVHAAVD